MSHKQQTRRTEEQHSAPRDDSPIPGIPDDKCARLLAVLGSESNVTEVLLYGSRAKGSHRPGSDIDLTVKGHGLTHAWLLRASRAIDDLLLPWQVDLSLYDDIANADLIEHIRRVGKKVLAR